MIETTLYRGALVRTARGEHATVMSVDRRRNVCELLISVSSDRGVHSRDVSWWDVLAPNETTYLSITGAPDTGTRRAHQQYATRVTREGALVPWAPPRRDPRPRALTETYGTYAHQYYKPLPCSPTYRHGWIAVEGAVS